MSFIPVTLCFLTNACLQKHWLKNYEKGIISEENLPLISKTACNVLDIIFISVSIVFAQFSTSPISWIIISKKTNHDDQTCTCTYMHT